jgi:CheY-like chemotaxis protein
VNVLLVEDEPLIRMVLADELRDAGFEVWEAVSGDEAADLASAERPPSLLLTDIHMPGRLDGLALGRLLRSRHPSLPVVYITGRPDVVPPLRSGEVLILKPFTPDDILKAVWRLLSVPAPGVAPPTRSAELTR